MSREKSEMCTAAASNDSKANNSVDKKENRILTFPVNGLVSEYVRSVECGPFPFPLHLPLPPSAAVRDTQAGRILTVPASTLTALLLLSQICKSNVSF